MDDFGDVTEAIRWHRRKFRVEVTVVMSNPFRWIQEAVRMAAEQVAKSRTWRYTLAGEGRRHFLERHASWLNRRHTRSMAKKLPKRSDILLPYPGKTTMIAAAQ